ncbi:MobF family relaxase [Salinibacterium sp. G-O1]|uniref:MobF family relaxase n=1 Tax=Salinibacterium sp. G-O1 TaxID=3046208 RepID=UPI0024B951A1|nr:MobF family relaxase [Salinibacterium sp. G-O1]MDJ0336592.1 MobF family relaxase [Salinibacterium sp. G-O1]
MRGGLVFFRGAGAAARAYLESDHSNADEYYLEDGGAVAAWSAWDGSGSLTASASLDGEQYQGWVDWKDPETGLLRGVAREETRITRDGELVASPASPRFVEMTVNCDKSLSVAAALSPSVSAALDEAQAAAGEAMKRYMAQNSVTRVGARGSQRFVPVERMESVSVVHRSSRAGDPHRHVHVQWNVRVMAEGKWRGLHTAATLKQQGALRGVGEAAINSNARLQAELAKAGFVFDPATGAVTNLRKQARALSKRAVQIQGNTARLERAWRAENPGWEPDAATRREFDQKAWAFERPRKRQQAGSAQSVSAESKWVGELRQQLLPVEGFTALATPAASSLQELDRTAIAEQVVTVAGAKASAWSLADLEGHVGVLVGRAGVRALPEEVTVYARSVAAEIAATLPRLRMDVPGQVPGWVRHLTSERVQRIEAQLQASFTARGLNSGLTFDPAAVNLSGLNAEQSMAARALATAAPLVVIEGAAGGGKTTMLAAARGLAGESGMRFIVLAPTLRAANEAAAAIGANASSAHKLAHEHGFRWDTDGRWTRLSVGHIDPSTGAVFDGPSETFRVDALTRLVIDEAGMLDQDLAHAVLTIADESGAPLALIGDRAQLPAVGRGGVLDMAVASHPRPLDLSELYRFREPGYAELTLKMRDRTEPAALFDDLEARGNIILHASGDEAWAAITRDVSGRAAVGASVAVAVATNEQAAELNALVQATHAEAGRTRQPALDVAGSDGLSLRIGDRVMTRRNDKELGVANRDTWTVDRVHRDGTVTVTGSSRRVRLPRDYVEEHTHLAYASTEYGVQGATVDYGHGVVTDSSSAQAVYVAATRGREHNALHIVAGDRDEARGMFTAALNREAGDRGTEAARVVAHRDVEGVILPTLEHDPTVRTARLAAEHRRYDGEVRNWESARQRWQDRNPDLAAADHAAASTAADGAAEQARSAREILERGTAAAAGVSPTLDAARAVERRALALRDRLKADPPLTITPVSPRPGTAEQEASKDAAYQARHGADAFQQAQDRGATLARERQQPSMVDRSPTPER